MATQSELCKQAFKALNSFKRHRALHEAATTQSDKQYHELQMYKQFDSIELSLRAIQSGARHQEAEANNNNNTEANNNNEE